MRTTTQIGEISVRIEADRPVLETLDQLHLILIALLGVGLQGLGLAHLAATNLLFRPSQLLHLLLDLGQITFGDGHRRVHIVVEPVFDARSDTELNARIECFQRLCHQV